MTAAFLQSELTSLISDSKRKYGDIKTAAEKSLSELKSISVTSETQLAGDLVRKSHFVDPFVLACKSQNVKIASAGAACLQRLVASTAVSRSRLSDVLQAFEEAVPLGLDVQLKVLQTLPSLLQLYAADLHRETLSRTLSVAADLSSSKLPMVSSTASATFQQLVSAVFTSAVASSKTSNHQKREDQHSARDSDDALAIFVDLCALLTEDTPQFVRLENLPPPSVLETLEGLLSAHGSFVLSDSDSLKACSVCLVPGLARLIDNGANFGVVVRSLRIAFILGSRHLNQLRDTFGQLLKVILRISDRPGSHKWKRLLGLEFFRGLCSDFDALRQTFATFDLAEGQANIISDFMASLVRTASEDPSLIGLGRQSTIPTSKSTEGGADLTATADVPARSVAQAEYSSTGISAELSKVLTPCLDLYDRINPPEVPETYVYTLVLGCISSFSDGLSRFIMPLSVPVRKSSKVEELGAEAADEQQPQRRASLRDTSAAQKYQHLVNPLSRKDLGKRTAVENCAKLIESCWPAVLATCSTFLVSALDTYFYHMLIRTVQKLTQVSGVLELNTPRDALLTTLAKVTVPANVSNLMNTFYSGTPALQSQLASSQEEDGMPIRSPIPSTPRQSVDSSSQTLNVRNLLCLRALLNLGIALGPTLSCAAWTIIMQSLEQVEALMSVGPNVKLGRPSSSGAVASDDGSSTLAGEIAAVDTARRRMFESTRTYPEPAFAFVCEALFQMIEDAIPLQVPRNESLSKSNGTLQPSAQSHKSSRSVSGTWAKAETLEVEVQFVLKTVGLLAHVNVHRFRQQDTSLGSWNLIIAKLLLLQSNQRLQPHLRLHSANIINAIVVESCTTGGEDEDNDVPDADRSSILLEYGIPALGKQLDNAKMALADGHKSPNVDVKITQNMLETLHGLVGSRGEDLNKGWASVFTILDRVVAQADDTREVLAPSAFKLVQLVVSDFLTALDNNSIAALLKLFDSFGGQQIDLNMSLTTIALYWNVAALITNGAESLAPVSAAQSEVGEGLAIQGHPNLDLWQKMVYSLLQRCKDARPDSRNAAARMLIKVMEASIPCMTSLTFNSYFARSLLPLLDCYVAGYSENNEGWRTSISNLLLDLVKLLQQHGSLLLEDQSFIDTWLQLVYSIRNISKLNDLVLTTAALDALSDIIKCLRQIDETAKFQSSSQMLGAAWDFWKEHRPSETNFNGPNQTALASHARLWLEMVDWNAECFASFEDAAPITAQVVKASIFSAQHEQYTMDVNRTTIDQEQLLQILHHLKRLPRTGKRFHTKLLVDIARDMTARTANTSPQLTQSRSHSRSTRQPTGVAFVTACIEELRRVLRDEAQNRNIWHDIPVVDILELSASLTTMKYGTLPTNDKTPLWQRGCLLGVDCAIVVSKHCQGEGTEPEQVGESIYNLLIAILGAPRLEAMASEDRPSDAQIAVDEAFDVAQLERVHPAMKSVFHENTIPQSIQKQCVMILFNYSLVARPWYNDLSADLENDPLKDLTTIRRGSVRSPDLPARRQMYKQALRCLLDHVSQSPKRHKNTTPTMASLAAPYILLRLSHVLKTFMADQPLRHLEHPHMALQEELHFVLRTFLDLRVVDDVFASPAQCLGSEKKVKEHAKEQSLIPVFPNDGKSHLRIIWRLVIRFEELWYQLPRLKKGHAWQDHEHGRGTEKCLKEWKEAVSEDWGPSFG